MTRVHPESVFRFATFELDVRTGELRKQGVKLRLQGQPLLVLAALLKRAGDLVTRDELRAELWKEDTFVDFDHSLHNAIARIREVLDDSAENPRYIETLPRRGYRFIGKVDRASSETEPLVDRARSADTRKIQSIAVLPLENLSADPAQDYFADGMTETLITSLAKIGALRVISRTSAMQYKGVRKSLPEIARELNVDAVIEGSVLRDGQRVRITTQLIHAATDQHLWAESYERDFRDILSLQSEIARRVASEIKVLVTPEEKARLGTARLVNPAAHEAYLRGRFYWNKRSAESAQRALTYFQQALGLDPTYAQGYAGLADSFAILGYYNALAPTEAYPKAKAAAMKALELEPSLAEPHATLGVIKRDFEWDWSGAEQDFARAVALNPGYAEAYHWHGTLHGMLGRHAEAMATKTYALSLDPLSVVVRTDLARMLYFVRDYEQSIAQYRSAIDMDPTFSTAHIWLGQVYEQKRMFDLALAEFQTGVQLTGGSAFSLSRLAHGFALAGSPDRSRSLLSQLSEFPNQKYVSPYDIAMVHIGLGEHDEAFPWLDRAFEERSLWMGYLNVEPHLDPLRADPRFHDLQRRTGLAEYAGTLPSPSTSR
jgi:TolB-like protein/Flp pilus assembly protein TadD